MTIVATQKADFVIRLLARSVVAGEDAGNGIGRTGLRHVPDASTASLEAFILDAVEPGSYVRTAVWASYSLLQALSYRCLKKVTEGHPQRFDRDFPRVHRVASLLNR